MKQYYREIIIEQLKNPQTTKQFACLLGVVDNECYLIGRGVRDVALVASYWRSERHKTRYPVLKKIVKVAGLNIMPVVEMMDARRNKYWNYFIYSERGRDKVKQIIRLREQLAANRDGTKSPLVRQLHRRIGRLFGYSQEAILRQYPK